MFLFKFHSFSSFIRKLLNFCLRLVFSSDLFGEIYEQHVRINKNTSFNYCYPFPDEWGPYYPKAIVLGKFLVYYAIPLIIIGLFYIMIAIHLAYGASVPGEMQGAVRQVSYLTSYSFWLRCGFTQHIGFLSILFTFNRDNESVFIVRIYLNSFTFTVILKPKIMITRLAISFNFDYIVFHQFTGES